MNRVEAVATEPIRLDGLVVGAIPGRVRMARGCTTNASGQEWLQAQAVFAPPEAQEYLQRRDFPQAVKISRSHERSLPRGCKVDPAL